MSRKEKEFKAESYGRGLAKDLLVVLGVGLAAGVTLIAAANKIATKKFEDYEDDVEFDD